MLGLRSILEQITEPGKPDENPETEQAPPQQKTRRKIRSKRKRERPVEDEAPASPPPATKKRIDFIFRELSICVGSTKSVFSPPPAPKKPTHLC